MVFCVTAMINLSALVIHLLQHLCQNRILGNYYQHYGLTCLYASLCYISSVHL